MENAFQSNAFQQDAFQIVVSVDAEIAVSGVSAVSAIGTVVASSVAIGGPWDWPYPPVHQVVQPRRSAEVHISGVSARTAIGLVRIEVWTRIRRAQRSQAWSAIGAVAAKGQQNPTEDQLLALLLADRLFVDGGFYPTVRIEDCDDTQHAP